MCSSQNWHSLPPDRSSCGTIQLAKRLGRGVIRLRWHRLLRLVHGGVILPRAKRQHSAFVISLCWMGLGSGPGRWVRLAGGWVSG